MTTYSHPLCWCKECRENEGNEGNEGTEGTEGTEDTMNQNQKLIAKYDSLPPDFKNRIPISECDSDKNPMSVFITMSESIENSSCGNCGLPCDEWNSDSMLGYPAATFQAELFCADCQVYSYNDDGVAVWTLTGLEIE